MSPGGHLVTTALACALSLGAPTAARAADADLDCKLHYNLSGWSLVYKHTTGKGIITCANGKSMKVHVEAKAVGLTAGASAPEQLVEDVIAALGRISPVQVETMDGKKEHIEFRLPAELRNDRAPAA